MENKSINRYHTFCKSLQNLGKSLDADVKADFVLEGTVLNYNLTFDIAWKVMKDILIKELEILDSGKAREKAQCEIQYNCRRISGCPGQGHLPEHIAGLLKRKGGKAGETSKKACPQEAEHHAGGSFGSQDQGHSSFFHRPSFIIVLR